MNRRIISLMALITISLLGTLSSYGQGFDSTQIGKKYPYKFPILGDKAYTRGYKLPLPHGVMVNTIFNRQNIVLENMQLAFLPNGTAVSGDDFFDFSDIIVFGPSTGRINTLSFRASTWILPFFAVSFNYGEVWGEQVVRLEAPFVFESKTDIIGRYYALDFLMVAPIGPVNLAVNWAPALTTNERLLNPVRADVVSGRVIYNFPIGQKPDRFLGVWVGAQYQKLASKTEGNIPMQEAVDPDGNLQQRVDTWYNGLSFLEKQLYGDRVYDAFNNAINTTVHYRFDKRLENEFNLLFGGQYQFNRQWQLRAEYGAVNSKQQLLFSLNYAFGL